MNQNNLIELIGPEVQGIFWITNAPIENRPLPFNKIDYLLNGILTQHLLRNEERKQNKNENPSSDIVNDRKNFFMAHNFGKPFFVAHIEAQGQNISKDFDGLMQLFKTDNIEHQEEAEKKTIIILVESTLQKQIDLKNLQHKFKGFNFSLIQ